MSETRTPHLLVIDDEEVMQDVLGEIFAAEGFRVVVAADGERGLELLAGDSFDVVLLDLMLPGGSGLDLIEHIKRIDDTLPVIMITAHATVETAIDAMKRGASDYLMKPFRNDELVLVTRRAVARRRLEMENRRLRNELRHRFGLDRIIGRSPPMQRVFDLIQLSAPSRSTILIEGESGTGKELVARAIHQLSPRADGPFVVVSCGSLPGELQESTLFGHVAGAFVGATSSRKGLFEMADGGTLFLDEVGGLATDVQSRLLRFLQEREIVALGTTDTLKVDVRIVAATHNNLPEAVRNGQFREDLFYRLKVISIPVPPLRDRGADIAPLANHFLQIYARENGKKVVSIAPQAMRLLEAHDWRGNVRELENVIQKAVVLCREDEISPDLVVDDLRPARGSSRGGAKVGTASYRELVDDFERDVILSALEQSEGVQKRAAEVLGLKPTTLNEKIKRLRIRYRI